MSSAVRHLRGAVDEDRVVDRLVDLVRIPSVNPFWPDAGDDGGEAAMSEYLGNRLADTGLSVERDEVTVGRPNLWSRAGTGDSTVVLAGHLDTVGVNGYADPFSGKVVDGRVYGRGSCDMKAALAAYLEVAEVLASTGVELGGEVLFAGIVDEEYGMIGSKRFGQSGPHADWAIIGEPTSLAICTSHLGEYGLIIRTYGRAVHSSIPETGVNAIEMMARVLGALADYRQDLFERPAHPLCGHGRLNPAVIKGGDMAAIVPDYCELEVDRRIIPGETPAAVVDDLRGYLEHLAAEDPDFSYELSEATWDIGTLDTPAASPVVGALQVGAQRLGLAAELSAFPAATDGPNLGVPAVICGPGALAQAHTIDEYVEVDETIAAVHLYLEAIVELLGSDA